MAQITQQQLVPCRQRAADEIAPRWTKAQINAGVQAVEDWFEANRVALGAAVETAVPGVFNATQKRLLAKVWLWSKFERGG